MTSGIEFEIIDVNKRRKERGAPFIKIDINEDGDITRCWYTPDELYEEVLQYGRHNFRNIHKVDSILKELAEEAKDKE